jgi:hypothetical protein
MLERLRRAQASIGAPQDQLLTKEKAAQFAKLSFARQYAEGIKAAGEITPEMKEETRGSWVRYQRETDPTALWASLQNKGAPWCTKGFATAETQLKGGDFYVYYTLDRQGKPTIPRIAIRMQGDQIGEVRGVADNRQNLEGNMVGIAEEKMNDLPGAERYRKASADMKRLTAIDKKKQSGKDLTKDDLVFLYELNSPIEGFGYERDPRIAEIRNARNPEEDMPIVVECKKEQIARRPSEINENTKAYVGPIAREEIDPGTNRDKLSPEYKNIFQKIGHLEHIYTSFPGGRIRKESVEIGGKDAAELIKEMSEKHINVPGFVEKMMKNADFTTQERSESDILIRLKIGDLGFLEGVHHPIGEIYRRIGELGLELCPPEIGPHYRLQHMNQAMDDSFRIGMKKISVDGGDPYDVFRLARDRLGLGLYSSYPYPTDWFPSDEFVFRLPKVKNLNS